MAAVTGMCDIDRLRSTTNTIPRFCQYLADTSPGLAVALPKLAMTGKVMAKYCSQDLPKTVARLSHALPAVEKKLEST